jgi:hypothetical protein
VRRISGSVNSGRPRSPPRSRAGCRCPSATRPQRPLRWFGRGLARSARSAAAAPWPRAVAARCARCPGRRRSGCRARSATSRRRWWPARPAAGAAGEDAVLLGGRQPRVERQDLGVRGSRPRSASAVSRISRSPERNTRMSPGPSRAARRRRRRSPRLVAVGLVGRRVVGVDDAAGSGPRPGRCGRRPRRPARRRSARRSARVDRRRGDDQLEVGPARQQLRLR